MSALYGADTEAYRRDFEKVTNALTLSNTQPLPGPFALHAALAAVQAEQRRFRLSEITLRADAAMAELIHLGNTDANELMPEHIHRSAAAMLRAASLLQQMALLSETMAIALADAEEETARALAATALPAITVAPGGQHGTASVIVRGRPEDAADARLRIERAGLPHLSTDCRAQGVTVHSFALPAYVQRADDDADEEPGG